MNQDEQQTNQPELTASDAVESKSAETDAKAAQAHNVASLDAQSTDGEEIPDRAKWGLGANLIVMVLLTGLLGFSGSVAGQLAAYLATGTTEGLAINIASSVGLWAGILVTPIAIARSRDAKFFDLCRFTFAWRDVPVGILLGVALQLLMLPLLFLPVQLFAPDLYEDVSKPAEEVVSRFAGWEVIVLMMVVGIGAPIVEELVFRGFVLGAMLERYAKAPAVLVSGAVFALAHLQPLQFIGLMAVGVVLALMRLKTGRLGVSVIAHGAFNLTAVTTLLLIA